MNLLIVDDQASVVEGLSRGIAWKMMGFENVYTAYNAAEAREILKKHVSSKIMEYLPAAGI